MRIAFLDELRGIAIALMVLDHAAVVFEWPSVIRDFTRLALPLFMGLSGYLFAGSLGKRYREAWFAAILSWPVAVVLNLALVHILLLYVLLLPLLRLPLFWVMVIAMGGLLQAHNWPIPLPGYQPGYVFAFLAIGKLFANVPHRIPGDAHLQVTPFWWRIGQWPLSIYVAHLWALYGIQHLRGLV